MRTSLAIVAFLTFLTVQPSTAASVSINLTLDTSGLASTGAGYQLDLALQGAANNTALFNNFNFGSGSAVVNPIFPPGVIVTASPLSVQLTDGLGNFGPEYVFSFTPGMSLSFDLSSTNNSPVDGFPPDAISIYINDADGNSLPTSDPSGNNALMILELGGSNPQPQFYAGTRPPLVTRFNTPEPATAGLIALAASLLGMPVWPSRSRRARFRSKPD